VYYTRKITVRGGGCTCLVENTGHIGLLSLKQVGCVLPVLFHSALRHCGVNSQWLDSSNVCGMRIHSTCIH
jgi:hypothetical protein